MALTRRPSVGSAPCGNVAIISIAAEMWAWALERLATFDMGAPFVRKPTTGTRTRLAPTVSRAPWAGWLIRLGSVWAPGGQSLTTSRLDPHPSNELPGHSV